LARLPVAVWLGALVAGSAVFRFGLARTSPTPWILPDEYVYSELARNLAHSGRFLVNGGPFAAWTYGPLYAVLTAPAWLLSSSSEAAYAAVQALNSIFMSSAAIFAYLLARRVLERPFAMFAAVLSLLVPSMIYTSRAMTESIAYPLFLAAVLSIVVMLERPSRRRQLVCLGVIALSTLARAEMIVLVPTLATAIGLCVLLRVEGPHGRSRRSHLSQFRLTTSCLLLLGIGLLAWWAVSGSGGLGPHGALLRGYEPASVARWLPAYLGELDLYLGVVPFAAFGLMLVLALRPGRLEPATRSFLLAAGAAMFWLVLLAALYSTRPRPTPHLFERYVFYVAPLALIALFVWIERGLPRPRIAIPIAIAATFLPLTIPYADLFDGREWGVSSSTVGLVPWAQLKPILGTDMLLGGLIVALCAAAALAFALVPQRHVHVLRLIVVANFLFITLFALSANQTASIKAGETWVADDPQWVDHAAGRDAEVVGIWSGTSQSGEDRWAALLQNQLWNRSVRTLYALGQGYEVLAQTQVFAQSAEAAAGGELVHGGKPLSGTYVLSDPGLRLDGIIVARDPASGLILTRVSGSALRLR
jgi:hypothetical protein